ncbi:hypothetical protein F0562_006431 [Nyssa sinensis]|uniref:RRM domain-containing protein n=1 Tax=Nyssa sinensis TaxID=561372 RepID=A0A5J5AQ18_9ASTE|nr:hypothetical protein F0562_006431 [Nyssa sinensis]
MMSDPWDCPSHSWNVSKHVNVSIWAVWSSSCDAGSGNDSATRHVQRVYVGGLPPSANEQSVATFFSHVMSAIGGDTACPGDAVVNVFINHEKKFAFVGIIFEGAPVKVRRPSDYNPSLAGSTFSKEDTQSICYKGRSEFNISLVLHVRLYNEICAMISAITSGQLADFIGHKRVCEV